MEIAKLINFAITVNIKERADTAKFHHDGENGERLRYSYDQSSVFEAKKHDFFQFSAH